MGRGLNHTTRKKENGSQLLFGFEGMTSEDLVAMAKWRHLYPSRTQKLSTLTVTIAGPAPVKITSCQVIDPSLGLFFMFDFMYNNTR